MNLNISTQFINNCLGNNVTKGNETSGISFTNLIETLNSTNESLEFNETLDAKQNEDKENIDYSSLISILNNIQTLDNINNPEDITLENLLGIEALDEIANSTKTNNDSLSLENLDKVILNQDLDTSKLGKEELLLLNLIKENLISKDSNGIKYANPISEDNNEVENNNITNKILEDLVPETESKQNIEVENSKKDLINQIGSKLKEQKTYKELENNTLITRNNIININASNTDLKDKDLNTLESILDSKDNNSFININNVNSSTSNITNKQDLNDSNVTTVRQEFIGEDIIKNINYMKSNDLEEIKIKLTPKELGDMTIKLVKNLEETKVHIIVSKDDVFDLVNKNIGDISKHLKDLNINVKEISVDIKSNNEKFFSDNLNQEFNRKNQENKKQKNKLYNNREVETIEEVKESNVLDNNLNILI